MADLAWGFAGDAKVTVMLEKTIARETDSATRLWAKLKRAEQNFISSWFETEMVRRLTQVLQITIRPRETGFYNIFSASGSRPWEPEAR